MYCRKCGKQLPDNQTLCDECRLKETGAKPEQANTSRMYGFAKALVGMLLGIVGDVLSSIACGVVNIAYLTAIVGGNAYYNFTVLISTVWGLTILSIPLLIIAMVFGVQSIKAYNRIQQQGGVKPIPALVLGIIAVVAAALSILMVLGALLMLMVCTAY